MKSCLRLTVILSATLAISACDEAKLAEPQARNVRVVTVKHTSAGEIVTLTGQVQAQDHVNRAFRVAGRLLERNVSVGDRVKPGQVLARLESQDARNALKTADADLSAAQATLVQAQAAESRQSQLFAKGITTKALYDQAVQQLHTATAQVNAARARQEIAQDNLGYTELRAEVAGIVTAKGAEPGEVVQPGQMVLQVARRQGRDAIFNVPAQLIRAAPRDPVITVTLSDDPTITATARVREVSPQADPTTGTYLVKVALVDPPDAMRLGATVIGRLTIDSGQVIKVPGTALTQSDGRPAVWIVDPDSMRVLLREVAVLRYEPTAVVISDGLQIDETVVAAGVHMLRPGQEVRLLKESASAMR